MCKCCGQRDVPLQAHEDVLREYMTEISRAIERIRNFFRQRPHVTLGGFAVDADLHRNTLYGLHDKSWNPTRETLEKCLTEIDSVESKEARAKAKQTPKQALEGAAKAA